jgi:gluconolactonase
MAVTRIQPEADRIIPAGAAIEFLYEGLEGGEGPVWFHEDGCLVFTDHRKGRRYRWDPSAGVTLIEEGTDHGNGMARDPAGRVLLCERSGINAVSPGGERSVVADKVDGEQLRIAIDVAVRSDGSVYFSGGTSTNFANAGLVNNPDGTRSFIDPRRDAAGNIATGFDICRARCDGSGDSVVAFGDILLPNGLAFSIDETVLYAADTRSSQLRAIPVRPDGELDAVGARVFFDFGGTGLTGLVDGLALDGNGVIYCAAPGGIWLIDPVGQPLARISLGDDQYHTNCAFGGPDLTRLFITTHRLLACIDLQVPGIELPPMRKGVAA